MSPKETCPLHNTCMDTLKEDIKKLENEVAEIKKNQNITEIFKTKIETTLETYAKEVSEIKLTLNELVKEVKAIGNEIFSIILSNKPKPEDKSLFKTLLENNNKVLFIVVTTLCGALLFLLGMKAPDIIKVIEKLI